MKIKSNIRAGAGSQKRGTSVDSTSVSTPAVVAPPVVYYPPVGRCVGI
jgi:hypothetical protein